MRKTIMFLLALGFIVSSCSSIDCPLNNIVQTKYRLYGDLTKMTDTLTISTTRSNGTDTILLNRAVDVDSFYLPASYAGAEDVLYFNRVLTSGVSVLDTVRVAKDNFSHFESVDCGPSVFHTLTSVKTTLHGIDSIVINNNKVTYDDAKAHFKIYFKSDLY